MRTALILGTALALLAPATVSAADPPVVFQTQPLGRLLDESRTAAAHLGGDKAVMAFNEEIKKTLGEKGFEGLDLGRPIVGYVMLPADPADAVAVVAFPVTGEKEFLAFCERWNLGNKPKAVDGGLYEVPSPGPPLRSLMRVSDGYAYVATAAADPTPALDPKALVPAAKLFDANERALATARVHFDRIPAELRPKAKAALDQLKKTLTDGARGGLGVMEMVIVGPVFDMAARYLELSKDAKEAALRLFLDPGTADLSVELTLAANPGTPLDKVISGKRPTANKFNGLLTPDTAAGFKTRLPFFNDELRDAAVKGLESLQKQAVNLGPPLSDFLDETLKGLIRTVKTGEFDIAAGLRGPDKDGLFTGVLAIAFEDPSAVEKQLKKLVEAQAPAEVRDLIKWDAAKAGNVSIHRFDIAKAGGGGFIFGGGEDMKRAFGENVSIAFAFAPKGIFLAIGPDPVAAVKDLLALKPAPSPVLDIVLNASRLGKFTAAVGDDQAAATVAEVLGKEDKLVSAASLAITGGKELKVTFVINLRLLPRAFLYTAIREVKNEAVPGVRR